MQIKAPAKTGKLKVAIKKETKKSDDVAKTKAPAPEVDLFSFDSEPAPPAQASTTTFDPFGPSPTTATTAFDPFGSSAPAPPAPSAQPSSFDPFGSSAGVFSPAAPPQAAFDPFGSSQFQSPAPAPAPALPMQQQFQQPTAPMQQQFQAPAAPMQQQFQPPAVPMQQQFQQPGARIALTQPASAPVASQPAAAEFGDFESAPAKPAPVAAAKWNDLGSLVNLGSITLNEDPKAKASAAHTQQSFAGLDGFTKSQQSMVSSVTLFII